MHFCPVTKSPDRWHVTHIQSKCLVIVCFDKQQKLRKNCPLFVFVKKLQKSSIIIIKCCQPFCSGKRHSIVSVLKIFEFQSIKKWVDKKKTKLTQFLFRQNCFQNKKSFKTEIKIDFSKKIVLNLQMQYFWQLWYSQLRKPTRKK
jgi:hypothetical protein